MQRDQRSSEPAVHFLGKGRPDVARPQPGLDVPDGNAAVEARERGDQDRGRVPFHQRHVRRRRIQPSVDSLHQPGSEAGERLIRTHDVEIGVHGEAELIGDLLEHLLVLSGRHHRAIEVGGAAQRRHHRSQLDGLGPRAHEHQDVPAPLGGIAAPGHPAARFAAGCLSRRATISRPKSQRNSLLVERYRFHILRGSIVSRQAHSMPIDCTRGGARRT